MGEWQDLAQSVFIGLIFSFLVAKLISMVISFREENLRVVRDEDLPLESVEPEESSTKEQGEMDTDLAVSKDEKSGFSGESSGAAENQALLGESLGDDDDDGGGDDDEEDDDWEGVESTELDEAFSAATAFVAAAAADRMSQKVSNDVQLQLYALYKIATEGPCSVPQPSALKMTARAKWNAWQRLGAMPPEEAMQKYIMIVSELYPTWASGSSMKGKGGASADPSSAKGPMGPVFSTFVHEEESDNELKLDAIHASAREGEADDLLKHIAAGVSVNLNDSEGRTPLHWAVDRGHLNVIDLLVGRNADVNAQDNEGQTPLHYAAVCDREAIAELLVKHNADKYVKDNDGNTPIDLCESAWKSMHSGS
ncbi:hypothetical protein AAC387_Pa11g0661 [Persea americana]